MARALTEAQSRARVAELRRMGCKVERRKLPDGTGVVLRKCPPGVSPPRPNPKDCPECYAANQTPEPNLLGYLVLVGFAAAGLWALTRPKSAQASPLCPPITRERLAAYNQQADVSVAYFPEATHAPTGEATADGRIFFPESSDQRSLAQPVIVIIAGDQFWRYEGPPGQPVVAVLSPQDKANYCSMA